MPLQEELPEEKIDWNQFLLEVLKVFVPVNQKDWYYLTLAAIIHIFMQKGNKTIYNNLTQQTYWSWSIDWNEFRTRLIPLIGQNKNPLLNR